MKDQVTNVVAVASITAPLWPLEHINQVLTTISLLAGILWLGLQIYRYLKTKDSK